MWPTERPRQTVPSCTRATIPSRVRRHAADPVRPGRGKRRSGPGAAGRRADARQGAQPGADYRRCAVGAERRHRQPLGVRNRDDRGRGPQRCGAQAPCAGHLYREDRGRYVRLDDAAGRCGGAHGRERRRRGRGSRARPDRRAVLPYHTDPRPVLPARPQCGGPGQHGRLPVPQREGQRRARRADGPRQHHRGARCRAAARRPGVQHRLHRGGAGLRRQQGAPVGALARPARQHPQLRGRPRQYRFRRLCHRRGAGRAGFRGPRRHEVARPVVRTGRGRGGARHPRPHRRGGGAQDGLPRRPHPRAFRGEDARGENPLYGHVICRCETVTEAEIVWALHTEVPATTIDGVKRRAGTGMGRCQGGFCGPRVLEIICRELGMDPLDVLQDEDGSYVLDSQAKRGA